MSAKMSPPKACLVAVLPRSSTYRLAVFSGGLTCESRMILLLRFCVANTIVCSVNEKIPAISYRDVAIILHYVM